MQDINVACLLTLIHSNSGLQYAWSSDEILDSWLNRWLIGYRTSKGLNRFGKISAISRPSQTHSLLASHVATSSASIVDNTKTGGDFSMIRAFHVGQNQIRMSNGEKLDLLRSRSRRSLGVHQFLGHIESRVEESLSNRRKSSRQPTNALFRGLRKIGKSLPKAISGLEAMVRYRRLPKASLNGTSSVQTSSLFLLRRFPWSAGSILGCNRTYESGEEDPNKMISWGTTHVKIHIQIVDDGFD